MSPTLLLLFLPFTLACSPLFSSAGLFLQSNADPLLADGSDCYPYTSLSAALAALPISGGGLVVRPNSGSWALGGLTIASAVSLDGLSQSNFVLNTNTDITPAGVLVLQDLSLSTETGAHFGVEGKLTLQGCTLNNLQSDLSFVLGTLEILNSHVTSSLGTLATLQSFGATVKLQASTFSNLPVAVEFLPSSIVVSPNTPSTILLQDCTFSQFQSAVRIVVDPTVFSGGYTGVSLLTVTRTRFEDFPDIAIRMNSYFWAVTILDSVFSRGKIGLQLVLNDQIHSVTETNFLGLGQAANITNLAKTLSFTSCTFSHTNQSLILAQASPTSLFSVSDCDFQDIGNSTSVGSVLNLQNVGTVSLVSSRVRNCQAKSGGVLYGYYAVLVQVTNCAFVNLQAANAPVYDFQYSMVRVQSTEVNTVSTPGNVCSSVGQAINLTSVTFRNAYGNGYVFYQFESISWFLDSLFDTVGAGTIFMTSSTATTPGYIYNVDFRNISFGTAFVQAYAAQIYYFSNVTFNVAKESLSGMLFANYGTLISAQKTTFSGTMAVLAGGVGPVGFTLLSGCTFANLTVRSLFAPGSATFQLFNSTFADVVVTNAKINPVSTTPFTLSNISLTRVKGQFLSCKQTTLLITGLLVNNCSVPDGFNFIDMVQSTMTLKSSRFEMMSLGESAALFRLDLQSSVTITSSLFQQIDMQSASGVIVAKQSSLQLSQITATGLTSTFLQAIESSLSLTSSNFTDIGQVPEPRFDGGVIRGLQMLGVKVSTCNFTRIQARNGGAVYITYTNPNKASIRRQMDPAGYVSLTNSRIESCSSSEDGAGLYLGYTTATLTDVIFSSNTARNSGGALALYCDPSELQFTCVYYINNTHFLNNKAYAGGGAIQYAKIKPVLTNWTNVNNTALYGNFLAAFPVELRYLQSDAPVPVSSLPGESGSVFTQPIVLGLYDELGQLIISDNLSKGSLRASKQSALVSGLQTVPAKHGVFSFIDLSVTDAPGSKIGLQLTAETIDYVSPNPNTGIQSTLLKVDLLLRECVMGEVIANSVCEMCVIGTFSFNTSDTVCKSCPGGLTCYGGANTTVAQDYWRPSNTSELLLNCYAKDICLGGNLAECDTGYEGRLCTFCASGYFRFGNFFCLPCGNAVWGVFRGVLIIIGSAVFLIIMILGNLRNTVKKKSSMSIHFRIFMNYNQVSMLMSSLQVKWPVDLLSFFEGLKMTGNASQFAFSNECLTSDSSINYLYQKAIVVAVTPVILIILACLVWGIVALFKRKTEYLRVHVVCSVIVLLLSMQPIVLQSSLQLFPCVEVEPGSLWLLHDMRVACWEGEHHTFAFGVALPAILIWCIGTPLFFWAVLFRQRKNLQEQVNVRRIGFLYSGYHPRFYFWEFVVVLRKSVMVMIANLLMTSESQTQSEMAVGALWIFTILQHKEMPFETRRFNHTEFLSLSASLVAVIGGALYQTDLRTQPGAYFALLIAVFFFNAMFLFVWVLVAVVYLAHNSHRVANLGKWVDKVSEKYW